MKIKKISKLTCSALIAVGTLTGCGLKILPPIVDKSLGNITGTADCSKRETLYFYHMYPRGNVAYNTVKQIVADFNDSEVALNGDVCVKDNGIDFWSYWDKIDSSITGNTAPDIYFHTLEDSKFRAKNNKLQNISALAEADKASNNPIQLVPEDNFYETQLKTGSLDGKIYSLPFTSTVRAMYYNKKLWTAAGLTDADIPTTWEELSNVSGKLTTYKSNGEFETIGFDPFTAEGQHFHQWAWLNGQDFWIDNGNEKYTPQFNTKALADTMKLLSNFPNRVESAKLQTFMDQFSVTKQDPFISGKVAMVVHTEGLVFNLKAAKVNFDYGVFPLPPGPNKTDQKTLNWSSSFSIEMFDNFKRSGVKKGKEELRNKGAWEFLKFFMNKESQKALFDLSPTLLANKNYHEEFLVNEPILKELAKQIENTIDSKFVPASSKWVNKMTPPLQEYFKKNYTIETALQKIQDDIMNDINVYCSVDKNAWGC